ncbi:hypothetical protein [Polyangium fumosum]|uniref:Uncharacterized protein n=1 Tax=Polyangium fumosum TaxID=889272 RepID=A0A4U1JKH7_9BACT|nr:hypothetical protein [Polyangium fumosum]TKD13135.1 hypothetical protein E8A74_00845 [Polyangium fumosum]
MKPASPGGAIGRLAWIGISVVVGFALTRWPAIGLPQGEGTLATALRLVRLIVAIDAARLVRSFRSEYRPVSLMLWYTVVGDLARWALSPLTAGATVPYEGVARIGFFAREALYWGWIFGAAALAVHVYLGRSVRPIIFLYGVALAGLFLAYPAISGTPLTMIRAGLHAAELTVITTSLAIYVATLLRASALRQATRPSVEHAAPMLFGFADGLLFGGPYLPLPRMAPTERWGLAQASYLGLYLILFIVQRGFRWSRFGSFTRPSRPAGSLLH